jgi:serine/threonine protein kinase
MEPATEQLSADAYLDEFKIIKTLGSGYHAKVKLAVKDGKEYAIKRFKQDTADLSVLEHELNIMSQLKHNNIVTLYEVRKNATYKKQNGCEYQCFAIILEYINGGELF